LTLPTGRFIDSDSLNRPVDRRALRKRGVLRELGAELSEATAWADEGTTRRLRRVNAVAATSFLIGGSLFAIGAAMAQAGGDSRAYCSVYLAGGIFFSCGGYASVLQAVNSPREAVDGTIQAPEWRWWAREPERIEWLAAAVLFVGTLVFAINIADSFIEGLGTAGQDRLIWSPDIIGCALFLISGHISMVEMGGWLRRPRDLGWGIVVVNQVGSILFMASAIASFVRPSTGDELAVGLANSGTLTGAICFAIAGAMQEYERPV
jgi:hypothetical protein